MVGLLGNKWDEQSLFAHFLKHCKHWIDSKSELFINRDLLLILIQFSFKNKSEIKVNMILKTKNTQIIHTEKYTIQKTEDNIHQNMMYKNPVKPETMCDGWIGFWT